MALLKNETEIRKYIKLAPGFEVEALKVAIEDAQEKFLRDILGETLLNDIEVWHNMETPPTVDAYTAILPYIQKPLGKFTLVIASAELNIVLTDSGFGVVSNSQLAPASKDRVAALKRENLERAFDGLETLLRFLEKNKTDYPEWVASDAYTLATRNLVNSAEEFDDIYGINKSRLKFREYRPTINHIEETKIKPSISTELYEALITQVKTGSVSGANNIILPLLKKAVVFFTLLIKPDEQKYRGQGVDINKELMKRDLDHFMDMGNQYLNEAITTMEASPDDYPLYRDSDAYMETDTLESFENKEENTIFNFGG